MTATAPDLWEKREHQMGAARRESKTEMPWHDRASDASDSALCEAVGTEEQTNLRKPMRRTLEWEKTSLRDECTRAPNENKMSDGGRERASLGVEVWKSSQNGAYTGPPFAPSSG